MNEDKQPQAQPHSEKDTRRKLIKGLAGLPAVLTLGNGAHAAANSNIQCVSKENPPTVPETNTHYVNDVAPSLTPPLPENNNYCVEIADVEPAVDAYGDLFRGPIYETAPGEATFERARTWDLVDGSWQQTDRACVVYVDVTSDPNNPQYFLQRPNDGVPATTSCYASFTPNM